MEHRVREAETGPFLPSMTEHRFHIGDLVRVQDPASPKPADAFVDAIERSSMLGIYEVTSLLPDARGEPQYRLKGIAGWLERAVRESQMAPAAPLRPPRRFGGSDEPVAQAGPEGSCGRESAAQMNP